MLTQQLLRLLQAALRALVLPAIKIQKSQRAHRAFARGWIREQSSENLLRLVALAVGHQCESVFAANVPRGQPVRIKLERLRISLQRLGVFALHFVRSRNSNVGV